MRPSLIAHNKRIRWKINIFEHDPNQVKWIQRSIHSTQSDKYKFRDWKIFLFSDIEYLKAMRFSKAKPLIENLFGINSCLWNYFRIISSCIVNTWNHNFEYLCDLFTNKLDVVDIQTILCDLTFYNAAHKSTIHYRSTERTSMSCLLPVFFLPLIFKRL